MNDSPVASGTLYFFCGKMGAGKSTRSKKLADEKNAVLISEDEWLAILYPGQISTFDDYRLYSSRLKPLVAAHVKELLEKGSDVILDFAANTTKQRQWFLQLANNAGSDCKLIYIEASDETCLKQIATRRREQPQRADFDNKAVFKQVNSYFQEPDESEGFDIQLIKSTQSRESR